MSDYEEVNVNVDDSFRLNDRREEDDDVDNDYTTLNDVVRVDESNKSNGNERRETTKHHRLLTENQLKREYYLSNPLKMYSQIRGETILPGKFKRLLREPDQELDLVSLNNLNKKKSLPSIFGELRKAHTTLGGGDDLVPSNNNNNDSPPIDRKIYRKKLFSSLKLNTAKIDDTALSDGSIYGKSQIDNMDNSKRIYNEFSKFGLSKPIKLDNVESIVKRTFKHRIMRRGAAESDPGEDELAASNDSARSIEFYLNAHTMSIKNMNEHTKEIKNHKLKLAKLNTNDSALLSIRNNIRALKSDNSTGTSSGAHSTDQPTTTNPSGHVHKGTIYNYRQAVKAMRESAALGAEPMTAASANFLFTEPSPSMRSHPLSLSRARTQTQTQMRTQSRAPPSTTHDVLASENQISLESIQNLLVTSNLSTAEQKHKEKVRQAREKIISDPVEKTNLNKMTILQPFEETKILINIDQVPTKLLNSVLNSEYIAPRYYIPPVRAYGYFKNTAATRVVRNSSRNSAKRNEHNGSSMAHAASPRNETTANVNNNSSQSTHHSNHFSTNHFNNNSIDFESIKSLSLQNEAFVINGRMPQQQQQSSMETNLTKTTTAYTTAGSGDSLPVRFMTKNKKISVK